MSNNHLIPYQIEVLNFSKKNSIRHNDAVISDVKGIYICPRCRWEGYDKNICPSCGNKDILPKSRIKIVDTLPIAPRRTLVELFKDYKSALRWGARFGTVISCHKIDKSYYLENIEHLNLKQEPITIEIEQDYVLTKALELERPRRIFENHKTNIEIVE